MSLTRAVPASVPSLFHSSGRASRRWPRSKNVPPTFAVENVLGTRPLCPGRVMSLTQRGAGRRPVARPQLAAVAGRRRHGRGACRQRPSTHGVGGQPPGVDVLRRRAVPAAVPSLVHSSRPVTPSSATKNSRPAHRRQAREIGELCLPGRMSLTRTVPSAGPIALPQLMAVDAVVGGEVQRAFATLTRFFDARIVDPWKNILHPHGSTTAVPSLFQSRTPPPGRCT